MLPLLFAVLIQSAPSCQDAPDCRGQAQAAIARGDFELAHDLAWRAMQKGKPNDADLMLVLARTQSLSGRPDDALVMLGRVADRGVFPDVANDPDFRRVRALAGWPALEARLAGTPAPAKASDPPAPSPSARSTAPSRSKPSADPGPAAADPAPSSPRTARPTVRSPEPAPAAPATPPAPAPSSGDGDALPFSAPNIEPFALAHDAVSRRFVLGDRRAHRLLVVDELSRNVVNFVSAASAGFYDELTALAIDTRRGDLWVASASGDGDDRRSVVHKLQLVSGRTLLEAAASEKSGALHLTGVAVTPGGTVYALDAAGSRLFRVRPGSRTLESWMKLKVDAPDASALAAADDRTLYIGGAKGLLRVDLSARAVTRVKSTDDLSGFQSLAWRSGSLLGIERLSDTSIVARIRLDPTGTRARKRQVLATSESDMVGVLAGDAYYYLAGKGMIKRIGIK